MKPHPKKGSFDKRPRELDSNPMYKKMSPAAKELYTKLLNRYYLSLNNGDRFKDEYGYYVLYTGEEACNQLNCKKDKTIKTFRELEFAALIRRRRHGYGNAYRIYVMDLLNQSDNPTNNISKKTTNNTSKKTASVNSEKAIDEVENSDTSYMEISDTDISNTYATIPEPVWDMAEQHFKQALSYDILTGEINCEILDKVFHVLISKYCCEKDYILISQTQIPIQKVRETLLKLNDLHIRFVCNELSNTTANIKNVESYCLYLLWNAPMDMEIKAQNEFNRNWAEGKI